VQLQPGRRSYACENPFLLTQVLRNDWDYPGFVMSDWGAAHSTAPAANAGLDQESGFGLQRADWFGADKLKAALAAGEIDPARIDLMVTRVCARCSRTVWSTRRRRGPADRLRRQPRCQPACRRGRHRAAQERPRLLPVVDFAGRIAVIGGHADKGVLSGGGSSQVYPDGTNAVPGIAPTSWPGPVVYYPSSPLESLRAELPRAASPTTTAPIRPRRAPRQSSDVAIVFGTTVGERGIDVPLSLDEDQDALIDAVADASRSPSWCSRPAVRC
jgi:beta-glucosidase